MTGRDAVALWLASGAAVLGLQAVWHGVPGGRVPGQPARGGAWAARGCVDPDAATAADWRAVPGVTAKAAEALASACQGQDCGAALPQVRGIGPVLRARIATSLCRERR